MTDAGWYDGSMVPHFDCDLVPTRRTGTHFVPEKRSAVGASVVRWRTTYRTTTGGWERKSPLVFGLLRPRRVDDRVDDTNDILSNTLYCI